ncbi:MAG TPA: glycosyltransferase family 25 protein [Chitinophagaceae bacterium]|nr:glycosyltransferase family 25 protein [Chitinophagaceae bacterium]
MAELSSLNSYFNKVYVITLERSIERHEKMQTMLQGLEFSFFYGNDKKELTMDELLEQGIYDEQKAISLHKDDKPLNTTQISCAWSHRLVYEDMIANNYERVLILEDDVIIKKEGLALFEDMVEQLPEDWELWYLDYHKNLRRDLGTFLVQQFLHFRRWINKLKWNHTMINNMYARKYKTNIFIAGSHQFSTAYAITHEGAKKLIELQTPIAFCSENLLSYACANAIVEGYVSVPKLFLRESYLQDKKNKETYVAE